MCKLQDGFMGMMITLKKRMVCIGRDDTKDYQYLMFGHYDGMDIVCTEKWYQLRPKGVEDSGGNVDIGDSVGDKYTLKLYFPDKISCEAYEQENFSYDIWRVLGNEKGYEEQCNGILRQYPFVSVAMINLSKKCVETEQDLIARMRLAIIEAAERTQTDLKSIHCAIMPSIGYADFVLLFLSDHLKKVAVILDYLRKILVKDNKASYAMLSNIYAISGFAKAGLRGLPDISILDEVKLSIRVNLRDGVSATQFKRFFDEKINKIFRENNENLEGTEHPVLYQVFGNSDCLILSDMPFGFFIPLFYNGKLLNPENELFQKYIQNTRSSIRVEIGSEEGRQFSNNDGGVMYEEYQRKFQNLIGLLKSFVKKYNFPMRTVNGLQTVMKTYLNLVQFSHCFDIEKVIGDAFEAVGNNVERTINLVDQLAGVQDEDADWYAEQLMIALKIFREKIEDYLADLRRSDRLFIEGQSLSHPSIGSATKLLFFYNKYINDMAEELMDVEERSRNNRYTFVVTSGGCDVTTAYDLFSYIDPSEESTHSLIIIAIPEMSLYDFRGTMFRLLHECFHFCGERMRDIRLGAVLKSLSVNTALVIGKGLERSLDEHYFSKIVHFLERGFADEDRMEIQEQGRKIVEAEIGQLIQNLSNELQQKLEAEFDKENSSLYYSRNMYPEVRDILQIGILASDDERNENSFLHYTYHEFMICQEAVADKLITYLKSKGVLFSSANIWKETAIHRQEMERKGEFDIEELQLIRAIFRSFAENTVFEKSTVDIAETELVTMDDIFVNLNNVFKECFADCMAAGILGLPLEDFILCFIYETWNLEKAFPDFLRIAMELKVLYGICGKLNEEDCQKIKDKVLHWEEQGFQYQKHAGYIDEACDKINAFLERYGEANGFGYVGMEFVENYLRQCQNFYKGQSFDKTEGIRNLSDMASAEDIYRLLTEIQNIWKGLSKG